MAFSAMDAMRSAGVGADDSFGPQLEDHFDFTLRFEHIIMTILPSVLLILASPIFVFRHLKWPTYTDWDVLLAGKLASSSILVIMNVAIAVLWDLSYFRSAYSLAAAALNCIAACATAVIVYAQHRHAFQSSAPFSLYLSVTFLLDIAKSRSAFMRPGLGTIGGQTAATAAIRLMMVVLEEFPRTFRDPKLRKALGRETISGFWNRSMFAWLFPLLRYGYGNTITVEDLPNLAPTLSSEHLCAKFERIWAKTDKSSKFCLFKAAFYTLRFDFFIIFIPVLCYTGLTIAQPFFVRRVMVYLRGDEDTSDTKGGLIGAAAFIYLGIMVANVWSFYLRYRCISMARGFLVSQVFKKNLLLDQAKAKEAAAVTLMSTDIQGIATSFPFLFDIFTSSIQLVVGIYFLARYVGAATALVAIPVIVSFALTFEVSRRTGSATRLWNQSIQDRVSTTSNILLTQLKGLKMTGLGKLMASYTQRLREIEMAYSKKARKLVIITCATGPIGYCFVPIVVIGGAFFWTVWDRELNAVDTITTLGFLQMVGQPLDMLAMVSPRAGQLHGCFSRIQAFLVLEERTDKREILSSSSPSQDEVAEKSTAIGNVFEGDPDLAKELSRHSVQISSAEIASVPGKDAILHGVNLQLERGSLSMVVGPTGSGKSTLLRAILGEADLVSGSIKLDDFRIAYCDQHPWIRNHTIQSNIVGGSKYESEWYISVLTACLLDDDVGRMPAGDQTKAGSGGISLSGGQKQGIALARAVYSRSSIVVLDDVLSALDRPTAAAIFSRLFSPTGLLKKFNTTVILATHSVEYFNDADQLIVVDNNGSVTVETDREGLNKKMLQTLMSETKEHTDSESDEKKVVEEDKDVPFIRKSGDTTLYTYYLKSMRKRTLAAFLVMIGLVAVLKSFPDVFVRIWVDVAPTSSAFYVIYVMLGVVSVVINAAEPWVYFYKMLPESAENLHWTLVETLMRSTLGFITSSDTGSLLNRFSQDMELIGKNLPMAFNLFVFAIFCVLTDLGIVSSGAQYAAAMIPAFFGLLYWLQAFYLRTSRQMRYLDLELKAPLYTQLTETTAGLEHIRSFGWQRSNIAESLRLLDTSQLTFYYMLCIQRWLKCVMDTGILFMAVFLVSLALYLPHTATQAGIGVALLNMMRLSTMLSFLITQWVNLETSLGALARLRAFALDTPVEVEVDDGDGPELPKDWPSRGEVEFVNMSATYGTTYDAQPVLEDVSVKIQAGQKVGIKGRTGSGKSTLILTLLNFLKHKGTVTIDGINISSIPRQLLRSRITTIPQDAIILPGSVRANLNPASLEQSSRAGKEKTPSEDEAQLSPITDEAIIEALQKVELSEQISTKGGLDAAMDEVSLSAGQKQLFSLARAILHQRQTGSKVVLVDEATSSIDHESDAQVQAVMGEVFGECTVVAIAHRVETIQGADVILEVENGRVAVVEDM